MPRVVHVSLEIPHRGRISRLTDTCRILRADDDLLPARAKAQGCLPKSPRPGVRIAHQPRGLPVHSAVGGHLYPRDLATAGKRIPRGRKMPGPETLTLPGSTDARAYRRAGERHPGIPIRSVRAHAGWEEFVRMRLKVVLRGRSRNSDRPPQLHAAGPDVPLPHAPQETSGNRRTRRTVAPA